MVRIVSIATIITHLLVAACMRADIGWPLVISMICAAGAVHLAVVLSGAAPAHRWILGIALGTRLLLWCTPATLSDDLYRYLWDGRVQSAGINPYAWAPDSQELTDLRDPLWEKVNHRSIPTIYPPVAQLAFRFIDGIWHDPRGVKAFMGGVDFLTVCLLLTAFGPRAAVAYGWCPLAAVEFAGNGHMDAMGILLCVAAVALLRRGKATSGAVAAALAAGTKLAGLVFLPAILRRGGVRAVALSLGVLAALYLPHLNSEPWRALDTYARNWEFNGALFPIVRTVVGSDMVARSIALVVTGFVLLRTAASEPSKAALWVLGIGLAFSPVIHPWYVLWLLPFSAICGIRFPFVLAATVPLSYEVLTDFQASGVWASAPWAPWAVYLPVSLAIALEWNRRGRTETTEPQTT